MYLFYFGAVLGLHCCVGFSLVAASRGCFLVAMCWLLIAVASLVEGHRLWGAWAEWMCPPGSTLVVHGLSCSAACGISLGQGRNPCPLDHQGTPQFVSCTQSVFLEASLDWLHGRPSCWTLTHRYTHLLAPWVAPSVYCGGATQHRPAGRSMTGGLLWCEGSPRVCPFFWLFWGSA